MATPAKLDLFKEHKLDYQQPRQPVLLDVGKATYLAIEGQGQPGGEEFQRRIGALYAGAYTMKFQSKANGRDYTVCRLESVLWGDGREGDFSNLPPERWRWQLLVRVPDFVRKRDLAAAQKALRTKAHPGPVGDLRLEAAKEGRCVQMLHVGPYQRVGETIEAMRAFAAAQGLEFHGRHHEIYLSDPRRVAPAKLKTILRHAVRRARPAAGARQ